MDHSYIGSGKIYLRNLTEANAGFFEVGNCSGLALRVEKNDLRSTDFMNPGGGVYNKVERITSVILEANNAELRPKVLKMALFGALSVVAGGAQTDESHELIGTPPTRASGEPGTFIQCDKMVDEITSVKKGPSTALTAGNEYDKVPGGIMVYSGGTVTLADGDDILITYTAVAADKIEGIVNSGQEFELLFIGKNEARSGKLTRLNAYRCKAGALAELALIGEEYASMPVQLEVTKDSTKTGVGISQYLNLQIQQ